MSIINKMLRELDRRHATEAVPATPFEGPGAPLGKHLRPVKDRSSAPAIWALGAALVLVAVALGAWLAWNLAPRWNFTGRTAVAAPRPAPLAITPAPSVPQPTPAVPAPASEPTPGAAIEPAPKPDMLQLATELTVPAPPAERKAVPRPEPATARAAAATKPAAPSFQAEVRARKAEPAPQPSADARIERRGDPTPRERAEAEYRRAMVLVNQGRLSEGLEGVRQALAMDPAHETARQSLVSLLFDARRFDDARGVLQDGLALNPANMGFAMLLARIMTERGDVGAALAVLQRHAPAGEGSADYRAFAGALFQRLGRHTEAIAEYQAALRLAPSSGVWWVGLGISLQAADRTRDALDAFRRAKATGSLTAELATFADQRIRQLQ